MAISLTDVSINTPKEDWFDFDSGWAANEPAGMTPLTSKRFISLSEVDTTDWYIAVDGGNKTFESVASAPNSPTSVLRHTYPAGFSGGAAGDSAGYTAADHAELFICTNVYWDVNWENHPTGTNKLLFITMDDFGGGGDPGFLSMDTDATRRLLYTNQGAGVGRVMGGNIASDAVNLGEWYRVEVYLKANTNSVTSDGVLKIWLNGTLVTHYTDVLFFNDAGSNGRWTTVKLEPTWGGAGGTVVSDFYLQQDSIYISGA